MVVNDFETFLVQFHHNIPRVAKILFKVLKTSGELLKNPWRLLKNLGD